MPTEVSSGATASALAVLVPANLRPPVRLHQGALCRLRRRLCRSRPAAGLALVLEGDFTYQAGRALTLRALREGLEFAAVFAHNDVMAGAAMGVLREAGRHIPDDVAIVGFDDLPLTTQTEPPLTAVHQAVRAMGEAAAGALLAHLGGDALGEDPIIIPTTFSVRASTVGRGADPGDHGGRPAIERSRPTMDAVGAARLRED